MPVFCDPKKVQKRVVEPKIDKRKGWCIEGMFLDFREPVTFEEAQATADQIRKKYPITTTESE